MDAAEAALILLHLQHDYPSQLNVKSRALTKIGVVTQTLRGGVTKVNLIARTRPVFRKFGEDPTYRILDADSGPGVAVRIEGADRKATSRVSSQKLGVRAARVDREAKNARGQS
jgi:hypothetical protein